jgi:uncharacterized lipoprotein YehR (DUF1307 family)
MRTINCFSVIILFFLIAVFPEICFAQTVIKGTIVYHGDAAPAAQVNIELLHDNTVKTLSDNTGKFKLNITNAQKDDSVIISSVGYKSIRMPVKTAASKSVFTLSEIVKNMDGVIVFNSHETIGSVSEKVGYYRSWSFEHTGGEIGRTFSLPYKKFKIDKIRFKAGNTCDTCLLRLHIRYIEDGKPGDEIIDDSISVIVNNLSLDSKISEFDLTPYDFTFKESQFFVGIEVLNCGNGKKGSCAFNFAGTEKGEYLYRTREYSEWKNSDDYTIYLKLFLRY